MTPHFTIKNKFQKRQDQYSDLLTEDILADICYRITGQRNYTCDFLDEVNVGRLATLEYEGTIAYVSFSEDSVHGRNSSFQSLPSAFTRYFLDEHTSKRMCFYFLPAEGSYESAYFNFMYRLMNTAGIELLNPENHLSTEINPFTSADDLILSRDSNRSRNRSNNSTYITKDENNRVQVYGKTYGASKKETTLLCVALSRISNDHINLYQITEQNLTTLPAPDMQVLEQLGNINIVITDMRLERTEFEADDSLRSPRFIYNLLAKLGPKKCTFCDCEIPELIQGAHIWPVASIKRDSSLSLEQKLEHAMDGDNGIWLCENHHKLLDTNLISLDLAGLASSKDSLDNKAKEFISNITSQWQISSDLLNERLVSYVRLRYGIS